MGKDRNFEFEDVFPESWTDSIQEFISNTVTGPLTLIRLSNTVVRGGIGNVLEAADAGSKRVGIAIDGVWRWRDTPYDLNISGGAATKWIWAVAPTANKFTGNKDETAREWELRMTAEGAEPAGVAAARLIGTVAWDGAKITALQQLAGGGGQVTGAMLDESTLSSSGDIQWSRDSAGAWIPTLKANVTAGAKKANIGAQQIYKSEAYGYLATPDKVTVTVPADGLIQVLYSALWKPVGLAKAAEAAIFVNGTQLKRLQENGPPISQAAAVSTEEWWALTTTANGLGSVSKTSTWGGATALALGSSVADTRLNGGVLTIIAPAGTYDIGVQFKNLATETLVQERRLWAWTRGFS